MEWSCGAGGSMLAARWSLTRPAVFCTLDPAASIICMWDLVWKESEPVAMEKVHPDRYVVPPSNGVLGLLTEWLWWLVDRKVCHFRRWSLADINAMGWSFVFCWFNCQLPFLHSSPPASPVSLPWLFSGIHPGRTHFRGCCWPHTQGSWKSTISAGIGRRQGTVSWSGYRSWLVTFTDTAAPASHWRRQLPLETRPPPPPHTPMTENILEGSVCLCITQNII